MIVIALGFGQILRSFGGFVEALVNAQPWRKPVMAVDILDQLVHAKVDACRLERARIMMWYCSLGCHLVAVTMFLNLALERQRWMTSLQDVVFLLVYLVISLMSCFSRVMTSSKTHKWCYSLGMLLLCGLTVSTHTLPIFIWVWFSGVVMGAVAGVVVLHYKFSVTWNAFHTCVVIYTYTKVEQGTSCDQYDFYDFWSISCAAFFLFTLVSIGLRWTERSECAKFRRELEAVVSSNEHLAVRSLLDTMCDAVVELDSSFSLVVHSPALSTMLMHGEGMSLQGMQFQRFMQSEQDRVQFENVLHASQSSGTRATTVCHSSLRDSMGNMLPIEIFHVPLVIHGHHFTHLIGIRENSDGTAGRQVEDVEGPTTLLPSVAEELRCEAALSRLDREGSNFGSDEEDLSFRSNESGSQAESFASDLGELALTLSDGQLIMVSCTPGFTALSGPLPDRQSFVEWLPEPSCKQLKAALQLLGNNVRNDCDLGPLLLRPPSAVKAGIEYVVSASHVEQIIFRNDTKEIQFRVVLSGVRAFRLKKAKLRRQRNLPRFMQL